MAIAVTIIAAAMVDFTKRSVEAAKKSGDLSLAAQGTVRSMESLSDAFTSIKENIGKAILENELFIKALDKIETKAKAIAKYGFLKGLIVVKAYEKYGTDYYNDFNEEGEFEDAAEAKILTLGKLNEQLKKQKDNLLNINIADKEAIRLQIEKIKLIEAQIKAVTAEAIIRDKGVPLARITMPKLITDKSNQGISGLSSGPKELKGQVEDLTNALYYQAEAVNILSNGFSQLFSSTGNGFQGMIDTIIEGIKRMVAELLAKAAILTLIRVLLPGPGPAVNATTELMNMFWSGLFSGGGSAGNVGGIVSQGVNVNVQGVIKGKDIALSLMRNQ
jgi:hypothetical protein